MKTFAEGDTIRTKCGIGRITYHPEWCELQPWVFYWNGTAIRHFCDVPSAQQWITHNRYGSLVIPS